MDRRIVFLVNEDGSEVVLNVECNNNPCAVQKAIRLACIKFNKGGWKCKDVFKEGTRPVPASVSVIRG